MPCQSCIERRAKMKAWIARRLGQGKFIDANPPSNVQAPRTRRAAAPVESSTDAGRQAIDTGTEHRKQRLEAVKASGPSAGRVSVPSVRKAGYRKGSPRGPQGRGQP